MKQKRMTPSESWDFAEWMKTNITQELVDEEDCSVESLAQKSSRALCFPVSTGAMTLALSKLNIQTGRIKAIQESRNEDLACYSARIANLERAVAGYASLARRVEALEATVGEPPQQECLI